MLLVCLAALRVVFIPAVMFCNHSSPNIPVLFNHDVAPAILVMLLSLTNGYLVTLAFTYAPKLVFCFSTGCVEK